MEDTHFAGAVALDARLLLEDVKSGRPVSDSGVTCLRLAAQDIAATLEILAHRRGIHD